MDIKFFDDTLTLIGILDDYTACIFHPKWRSCGNFEIHTDVMDKRLFSVGNYIMLGTDGSKTGKIEYLSASDGDNGGVVLKGRTLLGMLTQRVTVPPEGYAYHAFHGVSEDIMYALVRANAVEAANKRRNFPFLITGESRGRGETLYYQTRYDGLLDALSALSDVSGLGFQIRLDEGQKKLVFEVLEGTNRSVRQKAVSPVMFSEKRENIYRREYTDNCSDYKNCAYTGGQGDGADRVIYVFGEENTGADRYELFVDARDLKEASQLPDRAAVKLSEYGRKTGYTPAVDSRGYGTGWKLGDIVTVQDVEYGVDSDVRITEIEETYDTGGYEVIPTFGTAQKTITQKIKENSSGLLVEGIKGDTGATGETGPQGYSLQYEWSSTRLGVKREDEAAYQYMDLKGDRGEQGPKGDTGAQGPAGTDGTRIIIAAIEPTGCEPGQIWI